MKSYVRHKLNILDLDAKWRWAARFMLRPLYPNRKTCFSFLCTEYTSLPFQSPLFAVLRRVCSSPYPQTLHLFNIILESTPRCTSWSLPCRFSGRIFGCFSVFPCVLYASPISSDFIWTLIAFMKENKLLSPSLCNWAREVGHISKTRVMHVVPFKKQPNNNHTSQYRSEARTRSFVG
jgi:hypothetical protein